MNKPRLIAVTGRPGSGKTTLARALAQHLRLPAVIRDEIKEGYVRTQGRPCAELPESNAIATGLFFDVVGQMLDGGVSLVAEAAFQHQLWSAWNRSGRRPKSPSSCASPAIPSPSSATCAGDWKIPCARSCTATPASRSPGQGRRRRFRPTIRPGSVFPPSASIRATATRLRWTSCPSALARSFPDSCGAGIPLEIPRRSAASQRRGSQVAHSIHFSKIPLCGRSNRRHSGCD